MPHPKAVHLFEAISTSNTRSVALLLVLAAASISAGAQSVPDSASDSPRESPPVVHLPGSHPPSGEAGSPSDDDFSGSYGEVSSYVDPRAREEAAKLAELTGIRQKLEEKFPTMMQGALDAMRRQYPNVDPRFAAEWEKRMRAQLNADEFVAIFTRVYAEHFTADELEEMDRVVRARQNSKPVAVSPRLAEKIRANAVDIESEMIGAFSEAGARKGGEIGEEIGKEHPDWVKSLIPSPPATSKSSH